jgi:hypothetical protein
MGHLNSGTLYCGVELTKLELFSHKFTIIECPGTFSLLVWGVLPMTPGASLDTLRIRTLFL